MKQVDVTASALLGIDVVREKMDVLLLAEQRSSYRVFATMAAGFEHLSACRHTDCSSFVRCSSRFQFATISRGYGVNRTLAQGTTLLQYVNRMQ
jgi:hypothetical protein